MSAFQLQTDPGSRLASPHKIAETVRFGTVVDVCGRPDIVYLWTEPESDKAFMQAVHENRVMTLTQETVGSAKDFGLVGFFEGDNAAYLVFDKPLGRFLGRRVIGINYELIKVPGPRGTPVKPVPEYQPKPKRRHRRIEPAKKAINRHAPGAPAKTAKPFRVKFRFDATTEAVQEVEAESRKAAIEKASKTVPVPNFAHATVSRKVLRVESA